MAMTVFDVMNLSLPSALCIIWIMYPEPVLRIMNNTATHAEHKDRCLGEIPIPSRKVIPLVYRRFCLFVFFLSPYDQYDRDGWGCGLWNPRKKTHYPRQRCSCCQEMVILPAERHLPRFPRPALRLPNKGAEYKLQPPPHKLNDKILFCFCF